MGVVNDENYSKKAQVQLYVFGFAYVLCFEIHLAHVKIDLFCDGE